MLYLYFKVKLDFNSLNKRIINDHLQIIYLLGIMNLSQEVVASQETNPRLESNLFGYLVSVFRIYVFNCLCVPKCNYVANVLTMNYC